MSPPPPNIPSMPTPMTLTDLIDDAALFSLEHQLHLVDVLGEHDWHADLRAPRLEFIGPEKTLVCERFHLLGTAAPGPRSWLWAWANPSGFPEELTRLSAELRAHGERLGIPELTRTEIPFAELPKNPEHPVQVAFLFAEAAKALSGCWTFYTGEVSGGTRVAFLMEHPDFMLPAPEPARTMRVIQQALADLPLSNHRRALSSYAALRGFQQQTTPDGNGLILTGPGFDVRADFNDQGLITHLNLTAHPGQ